MKKIVFKKLLYASAFFLFFLAFVFFSFSISFPLFYWSWWINPNPIHIEKSLTQKQAVKEVPVHIRIPAVGIDLPIVVANVVNGYWELSDTTASYGLGSGLPGEKGNTVIFAHARPGLFLPLQFVGLQNKIFVSTATHTYIYKVTNITRVYPSDVAVIGPTKDETVTLFTCSGFADSMRLIVVAKPEE